MFLRALGLRGADEIIRQFYTVAPAVPRRQRRGVGRQRRASSGSARAARSRPARLTIGEGKKITSAAIAALRKAGIDRIEVVDEARAGAFAAADVVDPETGEVLLEANEELTERVISMAQEKNIEHVEVFFPETDEVGAVIRDTLKKDASRRTRRRSSRSTGGCGRAIRRRSTARARSSRTCSSTRRSTTSRGSAGSS